VTARNQQPTAAGGRKRKAPARSHASAAALPDREALHPAVREELANVTPLPDFLATAGKLTGAERALIVGQALILIEQNYSHLPLKRAMHAVDPVQRLKLLQRAVEAETNGARLPEADFHRELTEIFTSVRDLHTNYLLPAPFNEMAAFLPFMVEEYVAGGKRRYLVSHVAAGFEKPPFASGVEIRFWNGAPIERVVAVNAERFAGSNPAARHARGVQALTTRALNIAPPPDEEWVIVGYRAADGSAQESRFDWLVNPPPEAPSASGEGGARAAAALGLDLEQDTIKRMRKLLFAPHVVAAEKEAKPAGAEHGALESGLPEVFEARVVPAPGGPFGYLRIRTFNVQDVDGFAAEFRRLLAALPRRGLIVDVRGNGGGVIWNGELALQTLTPRRVEPEPFQFINTSLNLEICRKHGETSRVADLSRWVESMAEALATGSTFSSAFPLSDPEACNAVGQKYFGPVVLVVDALCYSTTDIFAAGFQDHEIGPVLGVDDNTGAGGANVWEQSLLVDEVLPGRDSVYRRLPRGAGMRVAMRRSLRVGRRAGTPLEDLGVIPDERHQMTRNDLLSDNVDLIGKACSLLAALPARDLTVTVRAASPTQVAVDAVAEGMARLDVYLADRPLHSIDLQGGRASFTVVKPGPEARSMEIQGFDGDRLVARYLQTV
jgi:hypothetical protein